MWFTVFGLLVFQSNKKWLCVLLVFQCETYKFHLAMTELVELVSSYSRFPSLTPTEVQPVHGLIHSPVNQFLVYVKNRYVGQQLLLKVILLNTRFGVRFV